MRDLTTIAAEELEARTALKSLGTAITNAEISLAAKRDEEAVLLERVAKLASEAAAAFERTLAIADRSVAPVSPNPDWPPHPAAANSVFGPHDPPTEPQEPLF